MTQFQDPNDKSFIEDPPFEFLRNQIFAIRLLGEGAFESIPTGHYIIVNHDDRFWKSARTFHDLTQDEEVKKYLHHRVKEVFLFRLREPMVQLPQRLRSGGQR